MWGPPWCFGWAQLMPDDSAHSCSHFLLIFLENQDRYQCVVKMHVNGALLPAFPVQTAPVDTRYDEAVFQLIRTRSLQRYTRPKAEVEAVLHPGEPLGRDEGAEPGGEADTAIRHSSRSKGWGDWPELDEE